MQELTYPCKIDSSMQQAFVHFADSSSPRPLLVALHTWSNDHRNGYELYSKYCIDNDWNMIYPEFRGPNWTSKACCSQYVVSDLEDAVAFMKLVANVDPTRIYLTGGSGGGHCSLYLAGRRPDLWTAVSAWCPISDVAAWYSQCKGTRFNLYAEHIELAMGNVTEDENAAEEARLRSPLTWLQNAMELPVDISTGIHDGHTGSVPVSQALNAYNALALPEDRIRSDYIDYIVQNEALPEELEGMHAEDPSYKGRKIILRRASRNVRLTLFEGTHEIFAATACQWLAKQVRGQKPDWSAGTDCTEDGPTELGK